MNFNSVTDVTRIFDTDYILFDFFLFLSFFIALIATKNWFPLAVSSVCGIIVYIIDGVIWWNTGIRVVISSPIPLFWVFFMLDTSYCVVAFSWMIIMLEKRKYRAVWTMFLVGGSLIVPIISNLIPLYDAEITTIRYMADIRWLEITAAATGYILMIVLKYDYKTILYVFGIGCIQGFIMEFSLLATGIRPSGFDLLIFDTVVLMNQGVPYIYVFLDKILPQIKERIGITPLKEPIVK